MRMKILNRKGCEDLAKGIKQTFDYKADDGSELETPIRAVWGSERFKGSFDWFGQRLTSLRTTRRSG